ncbi:YjjG family noncanonical pyrimidine nucleotidase [Arachidicoccus terrestris]|uniref:YjjG family noncanonical pyrimidine nucleotidase n=1 Tax=Arachidicoccus terrestris TaxID=2875539 RepID=UPI001CC7198F|nr:YjjG family noncanonical pyrimidine nucleotidase [Arachidicoccus terrestris]UAY56513.1 YjjG family noncanonical pyrimidine nucleotidase [Arachidicoccus terrestris]
MKTYQHLFFDLDHTIWDFEANAKDALRESYLYHELALSGIEPYENFYERYTYHNKRLWDRYTKGLIIQRELKWKRMFLTLLDFKIADEPLARSLSQDFLDRLPIRKKVFPYTFEILDYLKNKNYQLHLITNGFNRIQEQKLVHAGLQDYFEVMVTSEISGCLKPHAGIFEYAMEATGAQPDKSIMIGDNLVADIQGAANFGIDSVFTNHIEDTTAHVATYEVRHLRELEDIF